MTYRTDMYQIEFPTANLSIRKEMGKQWICFTCNNFHHALNITVVSECSYAQYPQYFYLITRVGDFLFMNCPGIASLPPELLRLLNHDPTINNNEPT